MHLSSIILELQIHSIYTCLPYNHCTMLTQKYSEIIYFRWNKQKKAIFIDVIHYIHETLWKSRGKKLARGYQELDSLPVFVFVTFMLDYFSS